MNGIGNAWPGHSMHSSLILVVSPTEAVDNGSNKSECNNNNHYKLGIVGPFHF